jgi:hypothetical protein
MAQAFDFASTTKEWVPRPFAAFAKGRVPGTFAVKAYAERFRNEISVQPTFTRT